MPCSLSRQCGLQYVIRVELRDSLVCMCNAVLMELPAERAAKEVAPADVCRTDIKLCT